MHKHYHRLITAQALGDRFAPAALARIIVANLSLDALAGQIGHDEYHFDANAFAESLAFMEQNRAAVRLALEQGELDVAYWAFGRLTHTAQDFYAHSNYISLWLEQFPEGAWPSPEETDPLDANLLNHPALRSGKLYYPLEALSFLPFLKKMVLPLLPRDAHAWMNLDGPEQGPKFAYALAAAVKRTKKEYEKTVEGLPPELISQFCQGTAFSGKD